MFESAFNPINGYGIAATQSNPTSVRAGAGIGIGIAFVGNFLGLGEAAEGVDGASQAIKEIGNFAAEHAYNDHVLNPTTAQDKIFSQNFTDKASLSSYVQSVLKTAPDSNIRLLDNGRAAFWDDSNSAVVIYNAAMPEKSTVFSPILGKFYFTNSLH